MTGPENSSGATRPISVAELLAKNGTIGAPPVGGRRRRRRGNSDAVTVAELTGEIPAPAEETPAVAPETAEVPEVDEVGEDHAEPTVATNETAERAADQPAEAETAEVDDDAADAVAEYTAHLEAREADAEQMSPDPVIDDDEDALDAALDLHESEIDYDDDTEVADRDDTDADLARRGGDVGPGEIDLEDEAEVAPASKMSVILGGAWIVGQCIIAVAFGAGLFIAFDQLWKWNNIVALVLSVLVILGLVVGVRVVRKTEDIGSTLIAVAVGALVTLGPLALLQSG
jgi:hypothetical protein